MGEEEKEEENTNIQEDLLHQFEIYQKEYIDKVHKKFVAGNETGGVAAFSSWERRFIDFLQSQVPEKIPEYHNHIRSLQTIPGFGYSAFDRWQLQKGRAVLSFLEQSIEEVKDGRLVPSGLDSQTQANPKPRNNNNEIFIVHGHDEINLHRLQDLLRTRWGINPIVMSGQPGKGRTLIEKFEEEAQQSAYAIVLMTPDDLIQMDEDNYTQARPNVIFELGWFYGRLGRPNVCILFKRGTKIHSDLDGISRIEFTESVAETKDELERELLAAGVLLLSEIAPILLSELKDMRSSKIRANAASALGKTGTPEILPDLLDATEDKISPGVRAAAKRAIGEILISHRWDLIFQPPNHSKQISFKSNGSVGEGQNENEHTWRIQDRKLELIREDGRVQSRFDFDKEKQRFIHTNDPDTLSFKDQIIQMM